MEELVKIVVTAPLNNADAVRKAIGETGGGKFGNYTFTSFSSQGTGRFKPEDGANPTIGKVGDFEEVAEERIEVTCEKKQITEVVRAIREAHSYEEPAIDIYLLYNMAAE